MDFCCKLSSALGSTRPLGLSISEKCSFQSLEISSMLVNSSLPSINCGCSEAKGLFHKIIILFTFLLSTAEYISAVRSDPQLASISHNLLWALGLASLFCWFNCCLVAVKRSFCSIRSRMFFLDRINLTAQSCSSNQSQLELPLYRQAMRMNIYSTDRLPFSLSIDGWEDSIKF